MIINVFIFAYLMGYVVFTLFADFGYDAEILSQSQIRWNQAFGVWQQFSYGAILAWGSLFKRTKSFERRKIGWVLLYSIVIGVWQVISIYTGADINDRWATIVAFCAAVGLTAYLAFIEERRSQKWLNKDAT